MVDSDTYTMTDITREATGEYKCSLAEKPSLEASINLTVSCELLHRARGPLHSSRALLG